MSKKAAVLWTGGKDCALAFIKAQQQGFEIAYLVTFVPKNPNFKAHSISLIQKQVEAISLPHLFIEVSQPMKESYELGIQQLKNNYQIDTLITGDIDEIEGHDNWIKTCCEFSKMTVNMPLWKQNRELLLQEMIDVNFEIIFTLVKKEYFSKEWIGKTLNKKSFQLLKNKLNVDICGENGEYHTMILNAPFFNKRLLVDTIKIEETPLYFYLEIQNSSSIDIN